MAASQYLSVSSQSGIETADLVREKNELETMPDIELKELAKINGKRGLPSHLTMQVAEQLTSKNALDARAKDELGINEFSAPRPLQAALASGASFICGGRRTFLVSLFATVHMMVMLLYVCAIVFLAISVGGAANAAGFHMENSTMRICFWGTLAMGVTALVWYLFGVKTI